MAEQNGGKKADADKPRTDLVPPRPILGAARVFAFGAKKYAARNWEQGIAYGRLYGALLRHLFAWWDGEELDPESGQPHLDHAMCCILMLHDMRVIHPELDDRPSTDATEAEGRHSNTAPLAARPTETE